MLVNLFLAVAKFLGGIFGRSQALIADGIESAMDVINSAMLWGALKYAERPPDEEHPYGHGKAESLAGVFGAFLLALAGLAVAVTSIQRIASVSGGNSEEIAAPAPFTLGLLAAIILIKEVLYRFVGREGKGASSNAMLSDAWHHRSDALSSLAAFVGISIALIGGPDYVLADAWAALFCCLIILINAILIFRNSIGEVMDERHSAELVSEMTRLALEVTGVESAEKCRVRKSGLTLIADIHVRVDGGTTVREGHEISHQVKDHLMQSDRRISDVTVHLEPSDPA